MEKKFASALVVDFFLIHAHPATERIPTATRAQTDVMNLITVKLPATRNVKSPDIEGKVALMEVTLRIARVISTEL